MIKLYTNFNFHTEVEDVVKLFFDCEVVCNADIADIVNIVETHNNVFVATTKYGEFSNMQTIALPTDTLASVRVSKRYAKVATYNCLKLATNVSQPWGSLTGIRPTKLAYQLIEEQGGYKASFEGQFDVSEGKIQLVDEILEQQVGLTASYDKSADLYVSIPFCLTRCSYCSFTAGELKALQKYVEPYVDTLEKEIKLTLDFAERNGYNIKNVYFGGGTPTSLEVPELKRLLDCINVIPKEYTVEAGRPDTITCDKLRLFNDYGVNRISINPQTFNQRILDGIGRRHSVSEIYDKYELARQFDFDINMDLIAGLPDETFEEFCFSVDSAIALDPENITVHTLALKKGSKLKELDYASNEKIICDMVDYSYKALKSATYRPYYMYRQKYMRQNLENVGYCKLGKQGLYNIDNMEETTSVFACGSGAISKRVFGAENRIERSANAKDVKTYIENFDTYLNSKFELFEN